MKKLKKSSENSFVRRFSEEITSLGGVIFYFIILLFFLLDGDLNRFMALLLAQIIIYAATFTTRLFYFKKRPENRLHNNFLEKIDASSFPSVHAARATVLLLFFIISFQTNIYLTLLFVVLAPLVLYSRIYLKKHDLADVIGGILLGIIASLALLII
ncbi:MAG: phosphatase PAP2 family protein [Nanoarchaeota archaeon]